MMNRPSVFAPTKQDGDITIDGLDEIIGGSSPLPSSQAEDLGELGRTLVPWQPVTALVMEESRPLNELGPSWEAQQLGADDGVEVSLLPTTRVLHGGEFTEDESAAAAALAAWPSTTVGHAEVHGSPYGGSSTGLTVLTRHPHQPAGNVVPPFPNAAPAAATGIDDKSNYPATAAAARMPVLSDYPAAATLQLPLRSMPSYAPAPLLYGSMAGERSSSPTSGGMAGRSRREYSTVLSRDTVLQAV